MTRTRKLLITALAAVTVGIPAVAASAGSASATVTTCRTASNDAREVGMCANAWARANLAPMSDWGVIAAGHEYCNIKLYKGSSTAGAAIRSHYGFTKGNAIVPAAEGWLC